MIPRIFFLLLIVVFSSCKKEKGDYVCPPCELKCDELSFTTAGNCPHCEMELITRMELETDLNLVVNEVEFQTGSGKFLLEGGFNKDQTILVHYHLPQSFTKDSKVILVLPGAGRNGKDYRDAWVDSSEKNSVLVISLEYSEENYPGFWSYNLAGMIHDIAFENETFRINQNTEQWIFGDFDRIFDIVRTKLQLTSDNYDMFGHSAGGQVLHRFAIFHPNNKASRILASNSGWYTIPTVEEIFPTGLRNIRESVQRLDFSGELVIFLGEKDDENETRGDLRKSPEVNKQGLHRLERGIYFYKESKETATASNLEFNWEIEVIPNIGHDYKQMSKQASIYLYGN